MTNRNKKRRPPPSGYRRPQPIVEEPERRGLLGSFLPARVAGSSPMPRIRTSFVRGLALALSTTPLVVGVPLVLLVGWLILIALGFQGPFSVMSATFSMPPLGTLPDLLVIGPSVWRGSASGSLVLVFVLAMVRSVLLSAIATVSVERYRTGTVTWWAARRLIRVLPFAFMANVLLISALIAGQLPASFLGPGLGLFAFIAVIVAGVYLLGSVPAIAADEDRTLTDTFRRSVQIGRLPGSGNLTFATLYVFASAAILLARGPGSEIGVNPSVVAWLVAICLSLLNVAVSATFAFRYLSVEALVEEPVQRVRAPRR